MSADNDWVSIPDDIVNKFEKYENALKGESKIFWFQFFKVSGKNVIVAAEIHA